MTKATLAFVVLSVAVSAALGATDDEKPLGDVARQQRQQQAKKAGKTVRTVTNEDIPEASPDAKEADNHEPEYDEKKVATGMSGDQVKAIIQVQKSRIGALQAQIDKLSASVHYVEANRYSNGVEHNQNQQRKQQEVDRMQKQLEGERSKLEKIQESARKAGFGSAIYDP
jgi:hypothetical protein